MTTTPRVGLLVDYILNADDAERINKRRQDARNSHIAQQEDGVVVHVGNGAEAGQKFPLLITRVWPRPAADAPYMVNGQVFLDGNDTLWVTSVVEGDGRRQWVYPGELVPGVHVGGCNDGCVGGEHLLPPEPPC